MTAGDSNRSAVMQRPARDVLAYYERDLLSHPGVIGLALRSWRGRSDLVVLVDPSTSGFDARSLPSEVGDLSVMVVAV